MKRLAASLTLLALLLGAVNAMGGGPGGGSPPEDDTIKVSLKPLDETNTQTYGWVRIAPDKFAVGANHLEPRTYYAVYLVSGENKQPMTDNPVRRTFGDGEFKFQTKLKEPFGGEWDKVVIYKRPNGEKDDTGMIAVLEGPLE